MKCSRCLWEEPVPSAPSVELTPEQRTAIISHLANQRGVLRGQAARERNRTVRYDIERNIDEINALIEVLRNGK